MNEVSTTPELEPWSARELWRSYWRVPVIGLLAAVVAFAGSFLVPASYSATTRILIRAKDSTILNSNGTQLGSQPGVVDSQLAGVLSDTQGALLSNRAVATSVVDKLQLDKIKKKNSGLVGFARKTFVSFYKRSRAIITHGFYKSTDKRTSSIDTVQHGLSTAEVHNGYALDIKASWDDPKVAAEVANAAADILVQSQNERFRTEADAYRNFLKTQTDASVVAEQKARNALANYKTQNGIVTTPEQDAQTIVTNQDDLNSQIRTTQSDLDAARAQVSSLTTDLANTSPVATSDQQIVTGRSTTGISNSAQNPVYTQLESQVQQAKANAASLSAKLGALQSALQSATGTSTGTLSTQEARLAQLELDVQIASSTRQQLAGELQTASVNASNTAPEITRIDTASAPTYPVSPKRYLFLAIGLLVGCLIGFVWSFMRVQRRLRLAALADADAAEYDDTIELSQVDLPAAERVETAPRAGNGVTASESTAGDHSSD